MGKSLNFVEKGSTNVFEDLGFDNAQELQAEAILVHEIGAILKRRKVSQRVAAQLLGVDQADVSKLMKGQFTGFSLRRLVKLLNRLDRDVELVISRHRGKGQASLGVRVA